MGIEIERKFLVKAIPANPGPGQVICQGYMIREPDRIVRVRTKGDKGYLTVKGRPRGLVKAEYEYEIPVADARELLAEFCEKPLIEKQRFSVVWKGFEWVIDRFSGENQGLLVAEIELTSPDQPFDRPPWAGDEVTHDPRYFNSNLIRHPFSAWQPC